MQKSPRPRTAPTFWWDRVGDSIVVQSDWPGGQRLAAFSSVSLGSPQAIECAEQLISDFASGRKTPEWAPA